MSDLQSHYRRALPAQIEALEHARAQAGAHATIRRIAHALRGSGGTYGFPQVSEAAAAVEDAPTQELPRLAEQLITVLRAVAAGAGRVDERPRDAGRDNGPERPATRQVLLLVDDDPDTRLMAGIALRASGYTVLEAEHAAEAAAQLDAHEVDAVLMDVMLADEDGIQVAGQLLAARPAHARPRLVFLTGATRDDQLARMSAASPAGILAKPFDPSTLAADVQRILSGAGADSP